MGITHSVEPTDTSGVILQRKLLNGVELDLEYHPSKGVGFCLWPSAFVLADFLERRLLQRLHVRDEFSGHKKFWRRLPDSSGNITGSNGGPGTSTDSTTSSLGSSRMVPEASSRPKPPLSIVELGCGVCALPGMTAAGYGCEACVVDQEFVVRYMCRNIVENSPLFKKIGGQISGPGPGASLLSAVASSWLETATTRATVGMRRIDYIVMADVVYYPHLFRPLLDTLKVLLRDCWAEAEVFFGDEDYLEDDIAVS